MIGIRKNTLPSVICCTLLTLAALGFFIFPCMRLNMLVVSFDVTFLDFLQTGGVLKQLCIFLMIGSVLGVGSWALLFTGKEKYLFLLTLVVSVFWLLSIASLSGSCEELSTEINLARASIKWGTYVIFLCVLGALVISFLHAFNEKKKEVFHIQNKSKFSHLLLSRICLSATVLAFLFPVVSVNGHSYTGTDLLWKLSSGDTMEYFIVMLYYGTVISCISWLTFLSDKRISIILYPFAAMVFYLCGLIDSWSGNNSTSMEFGLIFIVILFLCGLFLSIVAYGEKDTE